MLAKTITLASNASATSTGDYWPGGDGIFTAEATWGGGTAKLQHKSINGTWVDIPSASLTANGEVKFSCAPGAIRVNIATATAVYASATPVAQA